MFGLVGVNVTVWAVMTTINAPTPSVKTLVAMFPKVHVVIISDEQSAVNGNDERWQTYAKSPPAKLVTYLNVAQQRALNYGTVKLLPLRHFSRKNVGYLYAIERGADFIFDLDDDNLVDRSKQGPVHSVLRGKGVGLDDVPLVVGSPGVVNPYPYFAPSNKAGEAIFAWPRGLPLASVRDEATALTQARIDESGARLHAAKLGVVQSLANGDPDVDAVYRLTRDIPFDFKLEGRVVALGDGLFAPWNAQATLVAKPAFWGLLLPSSVDGRVSDIWRGYLASRLLWETEFRVAFASSEVVQDRNPHSYLSDFRKEAQLYNQTDDVLSALGDFRRRDGEPLSVAYLRLVEIFVDKGFLSSPDRELAQVWLDDLAAVGYEFPKAKANAWITPQRTGLRIMHGPYTGGSGDKVYELANVVKSPLTHHKYAEKYPTSIAAELVLVAEDWKREHNDSTWVFADSTSALDKIVPNMRRRDPDFFGVPRSTDMVVHLRLGETLDNPSIARKLGIESVEQIWNANEPTHYVMHGGFYKALLRNVRANADISNLVERVVIVAGTRNCPNNYPCMRGVNGTEWSYAYLDRIINLFQTSGYDILVRLDFTPDQDIVYMAHAAFYVPSGGSFTGIPSAVTIRGSPKCVWSFKAKRWLPADCLARMGVPQG